MTLHAFHQSMPGYLTDNGDSLTLTLALKGDLPERIFVRVEPDNEEFLFAMTEQHADHGWHVYSADVPKSKHIAQTLYLFKLIWQDDSAWLGSAGLEPFMPRDIHMYRYSHDRRLPSWSVTQVFYQIFPERFANGDPALTPKAGEYRYRDRDDIVIRQWGEAPEARSGGFEFYGGDLPGVQQKLDYLQQRLGVTALYLNPVFTSQSSHKYDTVDYFNVDPHFGGNDALVKLMEDAHQREMKVVLDAVINHTSIMHPWFQAAQQGDVEQRGKYVFDGNDYSSWKGHRGLPTLDYANPAVVEQMITADDSVIRHWLRAPYHIDGWRMDVIHMLGEGPGAQNNAHYLKLLREVIKAENEQALLLGEHFFEASAWLQGDQEDCAMNYFGFAHPVRAFLAGLDIALDPIKVDAAEFARWLREARARISFDHQLLQFNQLDSHDTPRFLSMVDGDEALLKVAVAFLMSYIGTPCLYYGTEIGMQGENDPDCRRTFPWNEADWNHSMLQFSQRWIELRKQLPALSQGALTDLYAQGDVMVFARVSEKQQLLVAVNRGDAQQVSFDCLLPGGSEPWQRVEGECSLTEQGSSVTVELAEKSVTLWQRG